VTGGIPQESKRLHDVRNHLSVIIGYCDLLLAEIPSADRKYADVTEMRKSATAAMTLLEDLREQP
jgi:hypothetical protein